MMKHISPPHRGEIFIYVLDFFRLKVATGVYFMPYLNERNISRKYKVPIQNNIRYGDVTHLNFINAFPELLQIKKLPLFGKGESIKDRTSRRKGLE